MENFDDFFSLLMSNEEKILPHGWQKELVAERNCANRLIRIPTGFGKTLGVLSAWLWHRLHCRDDRWPRRLIWCLPMRVLVEQTEQEVRKALSALGLLWEGGCHEAKVGVHRLMGGTDSGEWHLYPEHCAVLIGTQDMLLSRAMNRGYAAPRARWPMEFGLLNQDCLWVMDEVQLMDVGLATSMQLQSFRNDDASMGRNVRLCCTWWMSATLQSGWMTKSPDTTEMAKGLVHTNISASGRSGHLWDDVHKSCRCEPVKDEKDLAWLIVQEYYKPVREISGLAIVVVNRVERAMKVYDALRADKRLKEDGVEIRLIHSRFRPAERVAWRDEFLNRDVCTTGTKRIVVATQVIEAGVDISAGLLVSELAPWASLVQRFGRCARWGGDAVVIVADFSPKDDNAAAPYKKEDLDAAREALTYLEDVSPLQLEAFEEAHFELLAQLYPFDPMHLILRHELDELFDTASDLSGADIDISRFIRSGEERDLHVFWAEVPDKTVPPPDLQPTRDALCAVPFLKARDWLCGKETGNTKAPRLKKGMRAWVWDWVDGEWRKAERRDLYPGQTVLVDAGCGGYSCEEGWSPDKKEAVVPVARPSGHSTELFDDRQEDESLSVFKWQTIAVHGRETGRIAKEIATVLAPAHAGLLSFSGRFHDTGKGHPAFNNSIKGTERPERRDLAKAPKEAWLPVKKLYPMDGEHRRAGFRHELVSVLALFSVLQRLDPDHSALLGPWRSFLSEAGFQPQPALQSKKPPNTLEQEVLALTVAQFDLAAYLICAHHGKVRITWHAGPADQAANDEQPRILGLKDGDFIPSIFLPDANGCFHGLEQFAVDLSMAAAGLNLKTGMGWTERVLRLLDTHGPFTLAWMEAIFRAADQRASRIAIRDELLNPEENP